MSRSLYPGQEYLGQKKLPKGKIAFYTALYGLAGIQLWDIIAWII